MCRGQKIYRWDAVDHDKLFQKAYAKSLSSVEGKNVTLDFRATMSASVPAFIFKRWGSESDLHTDALGWPLVQQECSRR